MSLGVPAVLKHLAVLSFLALLSELSLLVLVTFLILLVLFYFVCAAVYDQRILEFDWSAISSPSFDAVCDLWNICWWLTINVSR